MRRVFAAVAIGAAAMFSGALHAAQVPFAFTGVVAHHNRPPTDPDWLGDTITGTFKLDLDIAPADVTPTSYFAQGSIGNPPRLSMTVNNPDGSVFASDAFASAGSFGLHDSDTNGQAFVVGVQGRDDTRYAAARYELVASPRGYILDSLDPQTVNIDLDGANIANTGSISYYDPNTSDHYFYYDFSITSLARQAQPIPEPSTYALMIAGLALVGSTCRRAKNAAAHAVGRWH